MKHLPTYWMNTKRGGGGEITKKERVWNGMRKKKRSGELENQIRRQTDSAEEVMHLCIGQLRAW